MQKLCWVEVGVFPTNGPVQVRAGYAAGGAAEPELVACFDVLALANIDAAEVHGERVEAKTVVDDDAVAFEVERSREDDDSAV